MKFKVKGFGRLVSVYGVRTYEAFPDFSITCPGSSGVFDKYHAKYCGKTLTVKATGARTDTQGHTWPIILAEESGAVEWCPWMIELIEDECRVDENLFLSCLLL